MMKKIFSVLVFLLVCSSFANARGEEPGDFTFAVFGDTRPTSPMLDTLTPATYKIVEEINLIGPDLKFHIGDIVWGYREPDQQVAKEYDNAMGLFSLLGTPTYFVAGNHEYSTPYAAREFYRRTGQKEYFSFDFKGAHFIILNTEMDGQAGAVAGAQLEWLKGDLELRRDSRAIFVLLHRPLFSRMQPSSGAKVDAASFGANMHPSFASEKNRDSLAELFARYKVKAVFAGHEHLFAKSEFKGVKYYTLGGGGADFAVPADEGGFLNYAIVTIKGGDAAVDVMEPYHFFVQVNYRQEKGRMIAEARIDNICNKQFILPLRGIKFTLPAMEYAVSADTIPPYSVMKKYPPKRAVEKVNASILKMEKSPDEPGKIVVHVQVDVPGAYSVLVTATPKE